MSCILTDNMPDEIFIDGIGYPINTDFRVWIKFADIMSRYKENIIECAVEVIQLCICRGKLPNSISDTMRALFEFYASGFSQDDNSKKDTVNNENSKQVYDFIYDAKYIFAAFMSQYTIDLTEASMHWFKFCALFQGLSEDEKISKIIGYRSTKFGDIKDRK
ncbi:MAG: Gp15 family bacteriophage protein, partial [Oscillospiraceae bacterium]